MTIQGIGHEICQLCGKKFSTLAKLDEHLKTAHPNMNQKGTEGAVKPGIEPADNTITTELPPGVEDVKSSL